MGCARKDGRKPFATTNYTGVVSVVLCLALCVFAWVCSLNLTEWRLVYAIDDAYIHLAHARNLAETGIWGIRPHEYAFCSSSPLWSCALAVLFKLFGYEECIPGVLAMLSCLGCAFIISQILAQAQIRAFLAVSITCLILVAVPVSTAALLGMEHATHILLLLVVVAMWLRDERSSLQWCAAACLATGIRYESLFVVLPICVFELVFKRYRQAGAIAIGVALPVVAYGAYAFVHGGGILPNSLVVKAVLPSNQSFFAQVVDVVQCISVENPFAYLVGVLLIITSICPEVPSRTRILAVALGIATFGHLVFAKTGWRYNLNRYEMYLFACGFVTIMLSCFAIYEHDKSYKTGLAHWRRACVFALLLVSMLGFGVVGVIKSIEALNAPLATFEIPMTAARILATLPQDSQGPVYLNDLGLIAERTCVPVIDVCGLGEQDTFELLVNGSRDEKGLAKILKKRKARYAAVFECFPWTTGVLLNEFGLAPAVTLRSPPSGIWVDSSLCLYAFSSADERVLARHAANLPFRLPPRVDLAIRPDLLEEHCASLLRSEGAH